MRENREHALADETEMKDLGPMMMALGYLVHIGKLVDQDGNVSPLCAGDNPRPINFSARESFVYSQNNYQYVTCASCMAAAEVSHA